MIVFDCINIAIIAIAYILSCISNMHMFQLNSYQLKSHILRLKDNKGRVIPNIIFPLISVIALFMSGLAKCIFLCIVFLLAVITSLPKKAKKPLVYTARVKRQFITIVVISIVVETLSALFGGIEYIYYSSIGLFLLAPVIIMISAVINKPIEKSISLSFVNDAKRILSSMNNMKIIGVTGSYGKTSVKYYLNTLLKAKYNVLMTPGSYNTPMGVVRTIREYLKASDEIFVCEMGARHVGDIKEICDIVHPHDGIITSIGPQHLETFKSLDNIKSTKFELADSVSDGGILFANMDDENIRSYMGTRTHIGYSIKNESDYKAEDISVSERGTTFTVVTKNNEKCEYTTKLIGEHNVLNIVGAIAVANTYGIPMEALKPQVRKLECVPHRLELKDNGMAVIIDDAYNSNPTGAKAALDVLGIFDGYRILVTPGMVELGEKQNELNKQFGKQATKVSDYIILVGKKQAEPIYEGIKEENYPETNVYIANDINDAISKAYEINSMGKKKFILLENDLPDNY